MDSFISFFRAVKEAQRKRSPACVWFFFFFSFLVAATGADSQAVMLNIEVRSCLKILALPFPIVDNILYN